MVFRDPPLPQPIRIPRCSNPPRFALAAHCSCTIMFSFRISGTWRHMWFSRRTVVWCRYYPLPSSRHCTHLSIDVPAYLKTCVFAVSSVRMCRPNYTVHVLMYPCICISVCPCVAHVQAGDPGREEWASSSVEFCGGTHVSNTGEAEAFVIAEESAVAKGIRRVRVSTHIIYICVCMYILYVVVLREVKTIRKNSHPGY